MLMLASFLSFVLGYYNMNKCQKPYSQWAKFQPEIESRTYPSNLKAGSIFWINQGINIGSEQNGKGLRFTRPALLIKQVSNRLAIVTPISSQTRQHQYRFKIIVNGKPRSVLLDQFKVIDLKRIEGFIDEIPPSTLQQIRLALANLICN